LVAVVGIAGIELQLLHQVDLAVVAVMEMERQQMVVTEQVLELHCRDMPVEKYKLEIMVVVAVAVVALPVQIGLMEMLMLGAVELDFSIQ
jgi:hypothetical protein